MVALVKYFWLLWIGQGEEGKTVEQAHNLHSGELEEVRSRTSAARVEQMIDFE